MPLISEEEAVKISRNYVKEDFKLVNTSFVDVENHDLEWVVKKEGFTGRYIWNLVFQSENEIATLKIDGKTGEILKKEIGVSADTEKEIIKNINRSLDVIMFAPDAPKASSNPYVYIRANQKEFDYIVSQGDTALEYFLEEFEHGKENGLREFIMAVACVQILGDKNPVKQWDNGREWYNQYIKYIN